MPVDGKCLRVLAHIWRNRSDSDGNFNLPILLVRLAQPVPMNNSIEHRDSNLDTLGKLWLSALLKVYGLVFEFFISHDRRNSGWVIILHSAMFRVIDSHWWLWQRFRGPRPGCKGTYRDLAGFICQSQRSPCSYQTSGGNKHSMLVCNNTFHFDLRSRDFQALIMNIHPSLANSPLSSVCEQPSVQLLLYE